MPSGKLGYIPNLFVVPDAPEGRVSQPTIGADVGEGDLYPHPRLNPFGLGLPGHGHQRGLSGYQLPQLLQLGQIASPKALLDGAGVDQLPVVIGMREVQPVDPAATVLAEADHHHGVAASALDLTPGVGPASAVRRVNALGDDRPRGGVRQDVSENGQISPSAAVKDAKIAARRLRCGRSCQNTAKAQKFVGARGSYGESRLS